MGCILGTNTGFLISSGVNSLCWGQCTLSVYARLDSDQLDRAFVVINIINTIIEE
jgi:hypothetical protein